MDFMEENSIITNSKSVHYLFKKLDSNCDGRIGYNDFNNCILPKEDDQLKSLATIRKSYYLEPSEPLPYEAEWALARVFD